MKLEGEGLRLRIFVHEALVRDHKPLYRYLVELARREHMAGATVFHGIEGFGAHLHLHTNRLLDASDDLPVIVEIIDTAEKIRAFMPKLDEVMAHGVVTLSPVHIVKYSAGEAP